MKRYLFALAGLAVLTIAGIGQAKVEADPNKEYFVSPADGEWMILGASYRGEMSGKLAHDLVLELRARYDLPAFVFDRSADEREEQRKDIEAQKRQMQLWMQAHGCQTDQPLPVRVRRIEEQRAVLIGGYRDMETARRALDELRKLPPPQTEPGTTLYVHHFDPQQQAGERVERTAPNPFKSAFVVHNPAVPVKPPEPEDDNKVVRALNAGESLSISRCRKPWTLAVASYQGLGMFQSGSAPGPICSGNGMADTAERLNACGLNAHNLAEALRKLHFEAYVYHTRYRSVVTVGGFDSKDDPRLLAERAAIMRLFRIGAQNEDPTKPTPPPPMGVLAQPLPMAVPKF
jgi:hypothetical protein